MLSLRSGVAATLVPSLLAVSLPTVAASPHLGVEIGAPAVKIVDGPDDDSDLIISLSVHVKNPTERELAADILVQGLDRDGAALYDCHLSEALQPGRERVFTDTDYIKERVFKSIVTWRVAAAIIRGGQPNNALQPTR